MLIPLLQSQITITLQKSDASHHYVSLHQLIASRARCSFSFKESPVEVVQSFKIRPSLHQKMLSTGFELLVVSLVNTGHGRQPWPAQFSHSVDVGGGF